LALHKELIKNLNNTEWVRKESAQWVEDGIITPEQRELIQIRYSANKASSPLFLFFAVIGSLLIGAGIILVFATNWWKLPVAVKLMIAFLPLLAAQGVCMYTLMKKFRSISYREGAVVFLSLSFFAALALIGQVFHTPSELESYILVCILFTLPGVYLFRAKAAMAIYIAGAIYVGWFWPVWVSLILTVLILPFFYMELVGDSHKGVLNYLLFLLTFMVSNTIIVAVHEELETLEIALICGLSILLLDALFRKIGSVYFFTVAKLLSILCITVTMLFAAFDFSYREDISVIGFVSIAIIAAAYIALRFTMFWGLASTDLFAASAIILMLSAPIAAGAAANLLIMALGAYYVVRGSRTLTLSNLNFGMALIISIIGIRFFDSSLDLLGRGIVFILLGAAFLGINLYISRKRKELQK